MTGRYIFQCQSCVNAHHLVSVNRENDRATTTKFIVVITETWLNFKVNNCGIQNNKIGIFHKNRR